MGNGFKTGCDWEHPMADQKLCYELVTHLPILMIHIYCVVNLYIIYVINILNIIITIITVLLFLCLTVPCVKLNINGACTTARLTFFCFI